MEGGREGRERGEERDRERGRGGCRNVGMGVRWERRGKGNGEIIIMYMCLISSSDVYIHCAQVWYGWLVYTAGGNVYSMASCSILSHCNTSLC